MLPQNGATAQELAELMAGDNINVFNASVSGDPQQSGSFTWSGSNFEIGSGVILSSGNIQEAIGPNDNGSAGTDYNGNGDPSLTNLSGTLFGLTDLTYFSTFSGIASSYPAIKVSLFLFN